MKATGSWGKWKVRRQPPRRQDERNWEDSLPSFFLAILAPWRLPCFSIDPPAASGYRTASQLGAGRPRLGVFPSWGGRIMPGKRLWLAALAMALLGSTGCCRFCERWCGHNYQNPAPVSYQQPACIPVCPQQPVCCPPGTAPVQSHAAPAQGWQRSYYVDPCCQ